MTYKEMYNLWLSSEIVDKATKEELLNLKDEKDIEDRFYKSLEFGTGGLRGIIEAGTNRMNIYTVGKVTQGLADYLIDTYSNNISVCIAYDSRIMSKEFAETAALTLCANDVTVYLFESLRPTPMLSYAVRKLGCKAGIVITASHNPKQYNGYKVYGEDGGQITDDSAKQILSCIESIKNFQSVKTISREDASRKKLLSIIGENIDKPYFENVKNLTIRKDLVKSSSKNVRIIYTPIHGTGNIPVRRVLKELGYDNLFIVREQESPDGTFPTASYPNPEEPAVFKIALNMAKDIQPDIIFGTDPDCDRIGVVVKDNKGEYKVLSGNQTGTLLTHYILSSLDELGMLPVDGCIVKTIVTTEIVRKIAEKFNTDVIDVLTGFKYIGEKIKEYEENKSKEFIFGFEESFGYLAGKFVRDKDAVIAAVLICEMVLYYKTKGMNLYDALQNLYKQYGYYKESLISLQLEGIEGQEKIRNVIDFLRHSMKPQIGNIKIIRKIDYKLGIEKDILSVSEKTVNLPKSNVLKFVLEDGSWFVVRPSGTEPKIKIYLSVIGNSNEHAEQLMERFKIDVMEIFDNACSS